MLMTSDSLQYLWTRVLMCNSENHVSGFGFYICHKKQGVWKVLQGWIEGLISHLSFHQNLGKKKKWALPRRAFWGRSCFYHCYVGAHFHSWGCSFWMSLCVYSLLRFLSKMLWVFFPPLTSFAKQTLSFQVKPVIINLIILCTAFDFFCILSLDPVINQSSLSL